MNEQGLTLEEEVWYANHAFDEVCDLCGEHGIIPNFEDQPEDFIMLTGKQFLCYNCRRE